MDLLGKHTGLSLVVGMASQTLGLHLGGEILSEGYTLNGEADLVVS